jgi:transcriptional regulator with XRE-family HTH domain
MATVGVQIGYYVRDELRVVREYLGLTGDWLAQHLGVNPRTVRAWEQGKHPIPDGVRLEIERLEQQTADFVGAVVAQLLDLPDPTVVTYRSDAAYHAVHPEIPFPASWHRAVLARIALEVPALAIVYSDAVPPDAELYTPRVPAEMGGRR